MKKIFSFDAETNGLWGQAFSLSAVVRNTDGTITTWLGRCPIEGDIDVWVAENVLPQMTDVQENYATYKDMLQAFSQFYMVNKAEADIIVHMGVPVESKVILDMHNYGFIGDWDAPYPLIDISAITAIGTSVDTYNTTHGITVPFEGNTHHPLYDSYAALVAYENVTQK